MFSAPDPSLKHFYYVWDVSLTLFIQLLLLCLPSHIIILSPIFFLSIISLPNIPAVYADSFLIRPSQSFCPFPVPHSCSQNLFLTLRVFHIQPNYFFIFYQYLRNITTHTQATYACLVLPSPSLPPSHISSILFLSSIFPHRNTEVFLNNPPAYVALTFSSQLLPLPH